MEYSNGNRNMASLHIVTTDMQLEALRSACAYIT